VRKAADVLIDVMGLNPQDRTLRLEKVARIIREDQDGNAKARVSHAKARLKVLKAKGICLDNLRCCIPPRPG
jgi:hypothetical protein